MQTEGESERNTLPKKLTKDTVLERLARLEAELKEIQKNIKVEDKEGEMSCIPKVEKMSNHDDVSSTTEDKLSNAEAVLQQKMEKTVLENMENFYTQ